MVKGFSGSLEDATRASKMFAVALGAAVIAVGGLAVKAAAEFEQTEVAMTTMLGSAEKAQQLLKDLTDFAAKTPFEFTGITKTAKQLLAFGIENEKLIPTLKSLGDVAAGLSVPIEQVAYAYGQVRSANQLYGTELRQFVNAGIPILAELASMFGVTTAEAKKMVEEGKVGFDDVEKAFNNMSGAGGRFNNLMIKQSATLAGKWSNLKDIANLTFRELGEKLLPTLKTALDGVIGALQGLDFDKIFGWLSKNKFIIYIVAGAIVGALIPAFVALGISIWAAIAPLLPFLAIGAALGLVVKLIIDYFGGLQAVLEILRPMWDNLVSAVTQVWNILMILLAPAIKLIKDNWNELIATITKFMEQHPEIMNALKLFAELLIGVVVVAIVAVIVVVGYLIAAIVWLLTKLIEGGLAVWNFLKGIQDSIVGFGVGIVNAFRNLWNSAMDVQNSILDAMKNAVTSAVNWIIDKINNAISSISSAANAVAGIFGGTVSLGTIPRLARGGIVTKPTLAMIGEAGAEAVVPLRGNNGLGNIIINITGTFMSEDVAEKVGDMIIGKLRATARI